MRRNHLLALCLSLPLATSAWAAATGAKPAAPAKDAAATTASPEKTPEAADNRLQTDIIGSREAPTVHTILPWRQTQAPIPKKEVTTSVLRETLQPLDRDVVQREIRLHETLSASAKP